MPRPATVFVFCNFVDNHAPLGGLKVIAKNAWFAARPSGTEVIYKIHTESDLGSAHLERVQEETRTMVNGDSGL